MNKTIIQEATGEIIEFIKTAEDTNGEYLEILVTFPPGAGPPNHKHATQTEYFEAVEGNIGLICGDKKISLAPGEFFEVPPDTWHRSYSLDGGKVKFRAKFTPALGSEYLLTEMFAACNRNHSKEPSPFDASYILSQANSGYYLKDFPVFFQKAFFPLIGKLGKGLGLVKAKARIS